MKTHIQVESLTSTLMSLPALSLDSIRFMHCFQLTQSANTCITMLVTQIPQCTCFLECCVTNENNDTWVVGIWNMKKTYGQVCCVTCCSLFWALQVYYLVHVYPQVWTFFKVNTGRKVTLCHSQTFACIR